MRIKKSPADYGERSATYFYSFSYFSKTEVTEHFIWEKRNLCSKNLKALACILSSAHNICMDGFSWIPKHHIKHEKNCCIICLFYTFLVPSTRKKVSTQNMRIFFSACQHLETATLWVSQFAIFCAYIWQFGKKNISLTLGFGSVNIH